MWARTTLCRDNWARLVAAVIKKDQIWQLCHLDSIPTLSSDFSDPSLRYVWSAPSHQLSLTRNAPVDGVDEVDSFGLEIFPLPKLLHATCNFSIKNIIERGERCEFYKGQFADGSLVAVKRFNKRVSKVMARKELEMASNFVSNRNVIGPIGFCTTENEWLLVYPYMPNGSVAQCLRERSKSQSPLKWVIRLQIALGVARGLAYLHHGCVRGIIHRNVKAETIMLDENFEAIVSYFALAKFVDCNDHDRVRGMLGNIAPEYLLSGKYSLKSDIYGYGVFLLELISGQRASDLAHLAKDSNMMLLDWVKKLYKERMLEALIDRNLGGKFREKEVKKLLQIALICTQRDPHKRPTMSEVVMVLEDGDGLNKAWEKLLLNSFKPTSKNEYSHQMSWTKMIKRMFQ